MRIDESFVWEVLTKLRAGQYDSTAYKVEIWSGGVKIKNLETKSELVIYVSKDTPTTVSITTTWYGRQKYKEITGETEYWVRVDYYAVEGCQCEDEDDSLYYVTGNRFKCSEQLYSSFAAFCEEGMQLDKEVQLAHLVQDFKL